jgi:uncharacterized protein
LRVKKKVRQQLTVFTRCPEPGVTKTRLIPVLGPDGAADIHRRMTSRMLVNIRQFTRLHQVNVEVRFDGGARRLFREWLGSDLDYFPQGNGDLGRRMLDTFENAFGKGVTEAIIIGADCPGIDPAVLQKAFDTLAGNELVLGPATDGGYYLIGINKNAHDKPLETLFSNISWGTSEVFERTIKSAEKAGITYSILDRLDDIDRPDDIPIWHQSLEADVSKNLHPKISVIIPALNEEDNIASTIASAQSAPNAETLVVDGGSSDGTVEIARFAGVKVLESQPGRACQMNIGAAAASGEILLFLHADTVLPDNYDRLVGLALSSDNTVCGAFELKMDSSGMWFDVVEKTANFRARRRALPYGDQGLFIHSNLFHTIGGYKEIPIMEDVELVRRLRRKGNIAIVPVPVQTSSRRYTKLGPLKTLIINKIAMILYKIGVSPTLIARLYNRKRGV